MDIPQVDPNASDAESTSLLCALATQLRLRGYAPRTATECDHAARHFLSWLGRNGAQALPFAENDVEVFIARHLPRCRCGRPRGARGCMRSSLGHLVVVARLEGQLVSPPAAAAATPVETWLAAFDGHLKAVRGLAAMTRAQQIRYTREFLQATFGSGPVDLQTLSAPVLVGFLTMRARSGMRQAAKRAATALRSFLRFLVLQGLCAPALVAAVPAVADWRARFLPKGLPAAETDRLLQANDLATPVGRRNRAVLLCLVRLGLRASEAAKLTLDDLDWRAGTLRIAAPKEGRTTLLPLPPDVARALVTYLSGARPQTASRVVFVTHQTPIGCPLLGSAVCQIVRRACQRAGLASAGHGAHALRHTLAARMVEAGVTLKDVADVLRHRHLDTTAVYTKVDLPTLMGVALPWPEVTT